MKQIKEDIKKHSFHSIYLLYGEESYLVSLYRDKLREAVLAGSDEINFSSFQGSGVDLAELRSMADTLPFFHDYRLVLLEDTRLFKTANDLADYLKVMPETTVLVFVRLRFFNRNFESFQIDFPQCPLADMGIGKVTIVFLIICSQMLDGCTFPHLSLHTVCNRRRNLPTDIRIFGVILKISSTKRIPMNI